MEKKKRQKRDINLQNLLVNHFKSHCKHNFLSYRNGETKEKNLDVSLLSDFILYS